MEINRVKFEKPDTGNLIGRGFTCVDMHMHSQYSDTYTKIENIIKKAKKNGIGVSITDHNKTRGSLEAYKNKEGVLVIPGIEVGCWEGAHVLFYFYSPKDLDSFYEKHVKKFKSGNPYTLTTIKTEELILNSKKYNSVVCLAHPFSPTLNIFKLIKNKEVDKSVLKNVNLVEVICGAGIRSINEKAVKWAEETKKGFTGGSDAHTLDNVGTVLTCSKAEGVEGFLESLKKKKNLVAGKETRILHRAISYSKQTNRHLRYLAPTLKVGYNLHVRNNVKRIRPAIKKRIDLVKNNLR